VSLALFGSFVTASSLRPEVRRVIKSHEIAFIEMQEGAQLVPGTNWGWGAPGASQTQLTDIRSVGLGLCGLQQDTTLLDNRVYVGLLIGAMLPYWFSVSSRRSFATPAQSL
jgi:hypothetical protein